MNKKLLIVGIAVLLLAVGFSGCIEEIPPYEPNPFDSEIIGKWYFPMSKNTFIIFNENGTGSWYRGKISSSFGWSLDNDFKITLSDWIEKDQLIVFHCTIVDNWFNMSGQFLLLNETHDDYQLFFSRENFYPEEPPMTGLPWFCKETEELFIFGYIDQIYALKIRKSSGTTHYEYRYSDGSLTIEDGGWETNLSVTFVGNATTEIMMLQWINSSDDVVRWNGTLLVRLQEEEDLTAQYSTLVRYVMGADGLYDRQYSSYLKVFEYSGFANIWYESDMGEWEEKYVHPSVDENGVISYSGHLKGEVKFMFSSNGTNIILYYLTETIGGLLPTDSEIFVYHDDYYGQRIYFKEDDQTYPFLVGMCQEFDMSHICWIPDFWYEWMWDTDCNYVHEPDPGIFIDVSLVPSSVQVGVPFDLCLRFFNSEGGEFVDLSFFVRINGHPYSDEFVRYATGIYYLYDFVIADVGAHKGKITAYRGDDSSEKFVMITCEE